MPFLDPPAQMGSAVPGAGTEVPGWLEQLCPAQDSPSLSSQSPPKARDTQSNGILQYGKEDPTVAVTTWDEQQTGSPGPQEQLRACLCEGLMWHLQPKEVILERNSRFSFVCSCA